MVAERTAVPADAGLEFCRLAPRCEGGLAALFIALARNGDERWFHPHPLNVTEASRLVAHTGADLYYVASTGDDVLAYGMLRGWESGFEIPSLGIALHPRVRGSGLARAFMLFLHAAARARGARQVRLKVHPDNAAAIRLYTSLGYQFTGEELGQLVGQIAL